MDTKAIFYVSKVNEYGSLSKAARKLYISPQALSKVIKKVENELGIELFIRSNDGMKASEKGKLFFDKSEALIKNLNELENLFSKDEESRQGKIKIASALGIIAVITPESIFSFQDIYPNFEMLVVEGDDLRVEQMVMDEEADIGFAVGDIDENIFDILKRRKIPHTLVVSKEHWLADRKSVSIKELEYEKIVLESSVFKVNKKFRLLCEKEDIEPNIYFETTEISLAHSLAKTGNYVAISVLTEADDLKGLKVLDFKEDFNWEWCMIVKKGRRLSKIEKEFVEFINL